MTDEDPFGDQSTDAGGETSSMNALVLRLAEIDDELSRRGIDPLVKEQEELRGRLKQLMMAEGVTRVVEESCGYEAVLQARTRDRWDVEKTSTFLFARPDLHQRVIRSTVDTDVIAELVKVGALSRASMEVCGAVIKELTGTALYVRPVREQPQP